jgi:hypothetical protein
MASDEGVWERGWVEHDREQLIRLARLPLAQKLQWLEEAHRLVRQLTRDAGHQRLPSAHRRQTES